MAKKRKVSPPGDLDVDMQITYLKNKARELDQEADGKRGEEKQKFKSMADGIRIAATLLKEQEERALRRKKKILQENPKKLSRAEAFAAEIQDALNQVEQGRAKVSLKKKMA